MTVAVTCDTETKANSWVAYFRHIGKTCDIIKVLGAYIVIRLS